MDRNLLSLKHLSSDLILEEILPRLPSKSLIRFSLVCKTWYSLITSPKFINLHFNLNRSESKDCCVTIHHDTCRIICSRTLTELEKFDTPSVLADYLSCPLQSCGGLILFEIRKINSADVHLLWNPSIRRLKNLWTSPGQLPDFNMEPGSVRRHAIYGLGFHESTKDYKVVQVTYFIDIYAMTRVTGHTPTCVDVYSLSTDSWHRVYAHPGPHVGFHKGVFLRGAIHWLATRHFTQANCTPEDDHLESIILFDFKDECFREMALPDNFGYTNNDLVGFEEFEGSLGLVVTDYEMMYECGECHLWVMKEYGVVQSWHKQFTFSLNQEIGRPVKFTKSGMFVWEDEESCSSYFLDFDNQQVKKIEGCLRTLFDFTESLILLED